MKKELFINFLWRAIQTFGKQGVFFLTFIISTRLLPQYDFGIYSYVMATIMIFTLFCDFGISQATSRHIAMHRESEEDTAEEVIFNMSLMVGLLSLISFIVLVSLGMLFYKENFNLMLLASPLILLIPLNSIQEGMYVGLEKFKKLSLIIVTTGIINILLSYILILKYGLVGVILAQILFYLISFLLLALFHGKIRLNYKRNIINNIVKYSIYIGISGLGYFLFSRIDIIILGYYGYIKEIANYEIINKLFALIIMPSAIYSSVISPKVSLMFHKKENAKIWSLYKKTILFTVISSLITIAFCYIFFGSFVKILFPNYSVNELKYIFSILSILIFSQMITSVISGGFSVSTGHAKLNMYFLLVFGVLLIPITFLAINLFQFEGVLYATVFVKIVSDILYIFKYTKIIKCIK